MLLRLHAGHQLSKLHDRGDRGVWLRVVIDWDNHMAQSDFAAPHIDEPVRLCRHEQSRHLGVAGEGFSDRAMEPAGDALPRFGREHHHVCRMLREEAQDPIGCRLGHDLDLAHGDAELGLDRRYRLVLTHQSPPCKGVPDTRESSPFGCRRVACDMEDRERRLGRQGNLEGVREGSGARVGEVGRMDDRTNLRHGAPPRDLDVH
jgi:hypothetical protein